MLGGAQTAHKLRQASLGERRLGMKARRRVAFFAGAMLVLACAAVLGGGAMPGQAAGPANQKVEAALACEPGTVAPGAAIGCTLTVANKGGNAVNNANVTVTASGGSFISTDEPTSCTISQDNLVLTCTIGKLNAVNTPGSSFDETHELQAPGAGEEVTQEVVGRFSSPTGNKRGNDTIAVTSENPLETDLNESADFDGKFSNSATDSVQTDPISTATGNLYSTGATLGTSGFAVGLTVEEIAAGSNNPNCPTTGCFGAQVIDFNITPLDGVTYPATFQLTIKVYVGPGVKDTELDVMHDTEDVSLCSAPVQTDPKGACIFSRTVAPSTKIATIVINGLGPGNGGWGVG
jgi:hypothetical protein